LLEKHHLKMSEWKIEPAELKGNDFISELLNVFVDDLHEREKMSYFKEANYSTVVRKSIMIGDTSELIEEINSSTLAIKRALEEREA
jgi:hypothetical protein